MPFKLTHNEMIFHCGTVNCNHGVIQQPEVGMIVNNVLQNRAGVMAKDRARFSNDRMCFHYSNMVSVIVERTE